MNLAKLFETQKVLRDRINYNEPDRFNKLILALLVELGECANEWRGFKFWSKNQTAVTSVYIPCKTCKGSGNYPPCSNGAECWDCKGNGIIKTNPLLEEYVDGLHFVLDLGLELNVTPIACDLYLKANYIDSQFIGLFHVVSQLNINRTKDSYYGLLEIFVGLGEMLGFTWEQIEQAYFEKNKENHARQERGY